MKNGQTAIFLDYFDSIEKVVPFVRQACARLDCKPIIVSSNFNTAPLTEAYSDLKVVYFDELLTREDCEFMNDYVFNLAPRWYSKLKGIEGITRYKGIQFGSIAEERAQRFFSSAIKNLEIVLKIIDRFQPNRIILIGEKDVFQNLCAFIKEELNITALFMEVRETEGFTREAIKKLHLLIPEMISNICDKLVQRLIVRQKRDNGIFIDARLYFEFKELAKDFFPYLYLIEKGLRVRIRLIRDEKLFFVPILSKTSFKFVNLFNPFCRYWKFIKLDTRFKHNFKYKDFPIWKIVEGFVKELIIGDFQRINKNIRYLEKLYKKLRPKIVILREVARESEKTIALTAKEAQIPTIVIQHGVLCSDKVNAYAKLYSDRIALWGRIGVDWYGARGNDTSGCIVTGKPDHDLLYSRKYSQKEKLEEILLKIDVDPGKEIILCLLTMFKTLRHMMSVHFPNDSEYIALKSILDAAKCFPEKQFIIKLHPFDSIHTGFLLPTFKMKKQPNVFFIKDVDLISLIENSSLVITSLFSSASLDAVILNKPLITLNFYKIDDLVPYAKRGVAIGVTKPEDLSHAIKQIFEDGKLTDYFASNRESFIYDYAYKIDGKATERVMNLIKSLYNGDGVKDEYLIDKSSV